MAGFNVMVPYGCCIITQVIKYIGYDMCGCCIDKVIIVCERVTLEYVAIVKQDNIPVSL